MADKKTLSQLEQLFVGEIEGRRVQMAKRTADKLERLGFLRREVVSERAGRFAMTVEYHHLTHAGRITYCDSCRDEPDPI